MRRIANSLLLTLALSLAGLAAPAGAAPPPAGSTYVAMGSSYASGPGVTQSADAPPNRCQRSADNYAHQLARKRNLRLVDVSCGGATTAYILGPWRELPAQLDAVTPDTRLVTVTIGGNDLGYVGGLMAGSCAATPVGDRPSYCRFLLDKAASPTAGLAAAPGEAQWVSVEAGLQQIVREVRRRAPAARLVFVDYLAVLPEHELCAQTPLAEPAAASARATARRLADLTAAVAERGGAEVVRASELSRGHDACAATPWMTGFVAPPGAERFTAYHPNLAGMTAVAEALDRLLAR